MLVSLTENLDKKLYNIKGSSYFYTSSQFSLDMLTNYSLAYLTLNNI